MPLPVSDRGSNKNEWIVHAAEVLGRSRHKTDLFRAIYRGKQKVKTVIELMRVTPLSRRRVLDAGKKLASQGIVDQVKVDGVTGYKKIDFFQLHRDRILRLAKNPRARKRIPTKRGLETLPRSSTRVRLDLRIPAKRLRARRITVDDIASFRRVRKVTKRVGFTRMLESRFKRGVAKILGERGSFKDWGGESRDLSSTRLRLGDNRRSVAFAFKGPGMGGKLTPGKMGKNGDQIQRLVKCPAEVFLIQYWREVDDSVLEQLENLARLKSYLEEKDIWYGIIDGVDSTRLIQAYPAEF